MIRNLYRYLVAVALISVLAAVAGCSSSTGVQGMIETPVFVGVSLHEAEAKAAEAGVQVEVQSSESSDTIPVNFILRQNPEPQTIVRKGRVITVVTSSGPVSLTLPDFVGGKFEVAQDIHCHESAYPRQPRRAGRHKSGWDSPCPGPCGQCRCRQRVHRYADDQQRDHDHHAGSGWTVAD